MFVRHRGILKTYITLEIFKIINVLSFGSQTNPRRLDYSSFKSFENAAICLLFGHKTLKSHISNLEKN
jgi:hypothetical protein